MSKIKLDGRTGLPEALQVLLQEYPRDGWQAHDQFHGLISFWLERHIMFRQVMTKMLDMTLQSRQGDIEQNLYASQLSRYARFFVEQLHGHHHIEDEHYFPALTKLDPRLHRGFTILDADHHELDGQLHHFTEAANRVLKPAISGDVMSEAGELLDVLHRFETFLDRHLVDEEELIVPIILKYGADDLI